MEKNWPKACLSLACLLFSFGFAAQCVSANGTSLFTCAAGKGYSDSHCKTPNANGPFGHVPVPSLTLTQLRFPADGTFVKIKSTVGGVGVTLTATGWTGTGSIENKVAGGGAHFVHGTGTIVYSGVTVTPFTKCVVYTDDGTGTPGAQAVVDTEKLTATTEGVSGGMGLKITPEAGEVFAKFWILDKSKKTSGEGGECNITGTYTVTGSVIATPEGATAATTHTGTTEQNTLKMGVGATKNKAGIEGSLTFEGSVKGAEAFNPLSYTTFTT